MRNFHLRAEADMRLDSDRRAEELARKRRESPPAAADDAPGPGPAGGPPEAGATAAEEGESTGVSG